jgi:hypothetical protein
MPNPIYSPASAQAVASVVFGIPVYTTPTALPATGSKNLFVSSGDVILTGLIGTVTGAHDATATNLKAYINASGGTDICAVVAVASLAVGAHMWVNGTFATAMSTAAASVPLALTVSAGGACAVSILWPSGLNLGINTSATNVGVDQWTCFYVPVSAGATVAPLV